MTRTTFTLPTVLFLLFGAIAPAQIVKKAQVGFRFLENPVAAEIVGKGSAGIVTASSVNAIFWNPAGLGWITPSVEASLNYTKGIADIDQNSAAAAVRLWDFGVVGFSLISMDYGTFYGTRRSTNSAGYEETGTFSPGAYAMGVAFSQKVNDRFSYGVHVKYAYQDLGKAAVAQTGLQIDNPAVVIGSRRYDQSGFAVDIGAYYDFLFKGITFGAAMKNISREIKYENEAFPLPFAVSFGLSVQPILFFTEDESQKFIVTAESYHPRDFAEKIKFGGEYYFMDLFVVRAGYMANYDERDLTAGVGIRHAVESIPVAVDYAFQEFGIFGSVHYLSVGVSY